MRFSFHRKQEPRWIDAPDFAWVPDQPFDFVPSNDARPEPVAPEKKEPTASDNARREPQAASASETPDDKPDDSALQAPDLDIAPGEDWPFAAPSTPPHVDAPAPDLKPEPAASVLPDEAPLRLHEESVPVAGTKHSLLLPRLAIGLAQGLGLYLLLKSRGAGMFPGQDPYLFSALALAGLFAPLVALEGLGDIALALLLPWTGAVAFGLAGLGIYHHWRLTGQAGESGYPGLALIMLCAITLFVAQALMRTWLCPRGHKRAYRAAFAAGWSLAARALVWMTITAIAWAFLGMCHSLMNALRPHGITTPFDPALVTLPLVGAISAVALHTTAGRSLLMRRIRSLLTALAGTMLPLMVGVGVALALAHIFRAPVPAAMLLGAAALLVIGINANRRGYTTPKRLRHWPELAAAFLILALTALAAAALYARVEQYGFTTLRVYAGALTALLACYGILYGGAALVCVGGGSWMRQVEPANFAMALVVIAGALALASPLGDPARLASLNQLHRLQSGQVSPGQFDFGWLRGQGLRFGHDALRIMTGGPRTGFGMEAARDAAITLSTAPDLPAATPTEIGANIAVRTPDARLPSSLLAQDWAGVDHAPPCLTTAAVACDAWFMDLDGDGQDEILLVWGNNNHWWASAMKQQGGQWRAAANLASPPCRGSLAAMRAGDMHTTPALYDWRDLWVAGTRLRLKPTNNSLPDCGALNFGH